MAALSPALSALLRPGRQYLLRDGFDRADSASSLGVADAGGAWAVAAGTLGISSGRGYFVTDTNGDLATLDAGAGDGLAQVTINGTLVSGTDFRQPQMVVRYLDANNYLSIRPNDGVTVGLLKTDGGVTSSLASSASVANTFTDGADYVLAAWMRGQTIQVYVNGTLKITYVLTGGDTKYAGYTRHGVRLRKAGTPATAARFEDFSLRRWA